MNLKCLVVLVLSGTAYLVLSLYWSRSCSWWMVCVLFILPAHIWVHDQRAEFGAK